MLDNIFSLFVTTVFTTVISVITKKLFKLLYRWFFGKDDE